MIAKKTKLLIAELKVIADIQPNEHCRNVLIEAAQRLEDVYKIAKFYCNQAEALLEDFEDEK